MWFTWYLTLFKTMQMLVLVIHHAWALAHAGSSHQMSQPSLVKVVVLNQACQLCSRKRAFVGIVSASVYRDLMNTDSYGILFISWVVVSKIIHMLQLVMMHVGDSCHAMSSDIMSWSQSAIRAATGMMCVANGVVSVIRFKHLMKSTLYLTH